MAGVETTSTMPRENYHKHLRQSYIKFMAIWDLITPPSDNIYERVKQTQLDLNILNGIKTTCYLHGCPEVKKSGNLHLAWDFAQNLDHDRFKNMFRVSPFVFEFKVDRLLLKE